MSLEREQQLTVPVPHPRVERVAALFAPPRGTPRERAVLLAHGAGADMHSEFLSAVARGLAEMGFGVLRFRYPYMERIAREGKRRPPDPTVLLEAAHEAALAELLRLQPGARPILAGKSLGGRIGTHLAARGADAAGLVLLGYPLHPAGRPERERSEHFPTLVQPALFVQGTRDALCELPRLRRALAHYGGQPTLAVIEGADHAFEVPARLGRTRGDVLTEILGRIDAWTRTTFAT